MPKQPIIYLDHAAATPMDPSVAAAMAPYFSDNFYNPSATYGRAQEARKALESARSKVAHWLGARSSEIIFTAGGTEANNLAIDGVMSQFPNGNVLVSGIEHESILEPAGAYKRVQVNVQADGRLDTEDFKAKIDDNTVLVSVMYANNEIGTIQPLREIAEIIRDVRQLRGPQGLPIYFHSDACQAANYLDLHVARLGVDLMTLNGGKIYGPKQTGVLYIRAGLKLSALIRGGGQERGLRSGTENVAGAVGFAEALEIAQSDRQQESKRLSALQAEFIKLIRTNLPQATVNGSDKYRLPNNIHLTLPGQDNERLIIQLDQEHILAAAGSACSASNELPSHVLKSLGLSDKQAQSSLRFTMGRGTNADMVQRTAEILGKISS